MGYGLDYDLSRLAYQEWNEQFENVYVPSQEKQPNLLQRLLAAISAARRQSASQSTTRNNVQQSRVRATAK